MKWQTNLKLFSIFLWLALIVALAGSLQHVAWAFATLEQNNLILGYVQAIAIDIGLTGLAFGIQQRKRDNRATSILWLGVIGFSAISTYANLMHGLVYRSDIGLHDWSWLAQADVNVSVNLTNIFKWSSLALDVARPIFLSGVLPVLVTYLIEIVGSDVVYQIEREERKEDKYTCQLCGWDKGTSFLALSSHSKVHRNELEKAGVVTTEGALQYFKETYPDGVMPEREEINKWIGNGRIE